MKIMTLLGTRPEIIRLSLIMNKLDQFAERHVIVYTGQNFTDTLSRIFFQQLGVRRPDYVLSERQLSLGGQLALIFRELEWIIEREKPDKVLVLGDTNSALGIVLTERMGIPSIHMEAGNRCFDLGVPEEKNRRIIDAAASYNLPYTPQSKQNLLNEGFPIHRIVLIGNPIYEVMLANESQIDASRVLSDLQLEPKRYFLVTAHRAENVDNLQHLKQILSALNGVAEEYGHRLICSIHPRTRSKLNHLPEIRLHPLVEFHEPFGFFDFAKLEKHACCVLTDSGTVQEECCIWGVPAVTIRTSTERPETVDCGSNIVAGLEPSQIMKAVRIMTNLEGNWTCPAGYLDTDVSDKVTKFLLGGKLDVS